MKRYMQQKQEQKIEQTRLIKQQQQIEQKLLEEVRITKIKAKAFACRRCFAKYFNNIKFHEHIRDHHAKRSKFDVSFTFIASFSTSSHSIIFSFDTSNSIITSKDLQSMTLFVTSSFTFSQSIIFSIDILKSSQSKILSSTSFHSIIFSSSRTSKRVISSKFSSIATKFSLLSNFASEFVSQHSKNASFISFYKFVAMQSTFLFNSIFKTSSKSYLIIEDLHRMFVEKDIRAKLFINQNNLFSSNVFVSRQTRIIFYFLFVFKLSKSTKFEIFTSMHVSMKQSTRASSSRSLFRSSFYFSSTFFFSTIFYFSFVCWRCQTSLIIYLHNNKCFHVVEKVEISMRRRKRRLF